MKTMFLSLAVFAISIFRLSAQGTLEHIRSIPVSPLPYNTTSSTPKLDQLIEPYRMVRFPYESWNGAFNINLWCDFNMTQSRPNNDIEDVCLYRRLPNVGKYFLCVLMVSAYGDEDGKKVMVTVDSASGNLIDQLEVGYAMDARGVPGYTAFNEEFSVEIVNGQTQVNISQIKLAQNMMRPITFSSTFRAYLLKTSYRINSSTGKFEYITRTSYQHRTYSSDVLSAKSGAFK